MSKLPEKVIRDGKVAVLISPGYGAGWSTWNRCDYRDLLLFDRRFVEAAEAGVEDIAPVAKELTGDEYVYCGGWRKVRIEWLPVGSRFCVEEYDGSESLRMIDDLVCIA
jgi:hypothetical protein